MRPPIEGASSLAAMRLRTGPAGRRRATRRGGGSAGAPASGSGGSPGGGRRCGGRWRRRLGPSLLVRGAGYAAAWRGTARARDWVDVSGESPRRRAPQPPRAARPRRPAVSAGPDPSRPSDPRRGCGAPAQQTRARDAQGLQRLSRRRRPVERSERDARSGLSLPAACLRPVWGETRFSGRPDKASGRARGSVYEDLSGLWHVQDRLRAGTVHSGPGSNMSQRSPETQPAEAYDGAAADRPAAPLALYAGRPRARGGGARALCRAAAPTRSTL